MVRSRKTIADAQALAAAHDGKCISAEIFDTKTRLKWQCKFEHELFLASYNNVAKGHWCSKCAGNKKKTNAQAVLGVMYALGEGIAGAPNMGILGSGKIKGTPKNRCR